MKRLFLVLLMLLTCGVANAAQWQNAGTAQLPGTLNVSDVDYNTQNYVTGPLDRLLADYREGMILQYSSASQITVTAGQVMVANSDASTRLVMKTSSATTVTWADIDTGAEAGSTTYYVYAIAATSASETATFKISASSTAPTGQTYYAKIGTFYNDASSNITLIMPNNVYPAIAISTGTVSNGATIPLPDGYVQSQCSWQVALSSFNYGIGAGPNHPAVQASATVDANRVVSVSQGSTGTAYANYIIIGLK